MFKKNERFIVKFFITTIFVFIIMIKMLLGTLIVFTIIILGIIYLVTNPLIGAAKNDPQAQPPVNKERLIKDVKFLTSTPLPRNSDNLSALNLAAEYIKDQFKEIGLEPVEQIFQAEGKTYKNIICSVGPENGARIILGAHYDVCGNQPGADDNASGVAGLLEIARLLSSQKPLLKYRIDLVAYTLEEPPFFRTNLMGSAVHAKSLFDNSIQVKAMICLEMIGYFSDKPNSQGFPLGILKLFYPTTGNFITVVGKLGKQKLARQVKRAMKQGSSITVKSINAPAAIPGIDFSDHRNYWKYNYDAVMITNTSFYRNHNYHQVTDTIETLDFDKMAEVVKGVYWSLVQLQK